MVLQYKCPSCGSVMNYDGEEQQLVCEHCGERLKVEEIEKREREEKTEKINMQVFKCPSCGAELVTDEYTSATFCNFCGNPALIAERITGENMPEKVIPFSITKEKAMDEYRKWVKKKPLAPKEFLRSSTMEKITGLYVPFWLYDYGAKARIEATCTRIRTRRSGNTEYTHTDYFNVYREVEANYEKIPVDASKKMDDDVMDKLEPFRYSDLKTFEMPYLSGYLAEKYNYTENEMQERAEDRVRDYIISSARNTINGYATTVITRQDASCEKRGFNYALLPVWMLHYRYKEKDYTFTMNGQTGKIIGNLPTSGKRAALWFTGIFAGVFVIASVIGGLI